jgi:hypothetical protein
VSAFGVPGSHIDFDVELILDSRTLPEKPLAQAGESIWKSQHYDAKMNYGV